jgi:hypothetical protein
MGLYGEADYIQWLAHPGIMPRTPGVPESLSSLQPSDLE